METEPDSVICNFSKIAVEFEIYLEPSTLFNMLSYKL